jgi:myo-inositol-1(or 4)-monophosphatase
MAQIHPEIRVMMQAAEKAARSLNRDFGEVEHLQVSKKGPGDFVSAADKRSEEIIFEELKRARPRYGFLMEESGEVKGEEAGTRYIIDPLDGTSNFLHALPHWAISIALEKDGEVIGGVIHDPVKNEVFHAFKNCGAFSGRSRLRVSERNDPMASAIATGSPRRAVEKQARFIREYGAMSQFSPGLRRFGAAALDLAYVAAGRYEGFWERDLKSWDVAAGILLVKEAGGLVSDLDDAHNNPVHTGNVLATNTALGPQIKKVLQDAQT